MSIETHIFNALGPLVDNRCYPVVLPASNLTWPVIRYTFSAVVPENTLCGASDQEAYRLQIDLYGPIYDDLTTLRLAVFAAIEAAFESAERQVDLPDFEPDARLHRRVIDYLVWFNTDPRDA